MRSQLVYRASEKVQNRFQLCCITAFSARRMNQASVAMHTTINRALTAIGAQTAVVMPPAPVTEVAVLEAEAFVPLLGPSA